MAFIGLFVCLFVKRGFGAFYNLFLSLVIAKFAQANNTGSYFLFQAGDNKIDCNKTKLGVIAVFCSADSSHQTESSFQHSWDKKEEQAVYISIFHLTIE